MPVDPDEYLLALMAPMSSIFHGIGITASSLAKQLKQELKAKTSNIIRVKGAVKEDRLKNGTKVLAISGYTAEDGTFKTLETVLQIDHVAWDVRSKARMDAQKLLGLYPAEKVDVTYRHEDALDELE